MGVLLSSLTGSTQEPGFALRPIVSINLKSSGYKLVLNDGTGGEKYKITKGTE